MGLSGQNHALAAWAKEIVVTDNDTKWIAVCMSVLRLLRPDNEQDRGVNKVNKTMHIGKTD